MLYTEFLTNEAFSAVKNKTVLEIGALGDKITDCIKNAGASNVETVDPFGKATFRGTANDYYNTRVDKFDVVTCMGLLYHLHSPWHLLEQIINHSQPDTLIVETTAYAQGIGEEKFNTVGNAYSDKNIKHPIRIYSNYVKDDFIRGIETTPMKLNECWEYKDLEFEDLAESNKINMWLGVFNRDKI